MFLIGASQADPDASGSNLDSMQGDPSQTFAVSAEQYRARCVFLAPTDYKTSFVDVIGESGTKLEVDGADVSSKLEPVTGTTWLKARIELDAAKNDGLHVLTGSKPVGIQVIGYGDYTTSMYPGGLNLGRSRQRR